MLAEITGDRPEIITGPPDAGFEVFGAMHVGPHFAIIFDGKQRLWHFFKLRRIFSSNCASGGWFHISLRDRKARDSGT